MRYHPFVFLLFVSVLLVSACRTRRPDPPAPTPPARPAAAVLTVILRADPALDTLTVTNVIRAPGALREDYPLSVPTPPAGELLFTFLGPEDRVLRQTTLPYPGPNRYEVPSEEGTIESVTVPEADRILLLRTNASSTLRRLRVTGQTPDGRPIDQLIGLTPR